MKTDTLIDVLSKNLEPVDTRKPTRILRLAVLSGLVIAAGAAILVLGIRLDIGESAPLGYLLLKLFFSGAVVASGSMLLAKMVRPGGERRPWMAATLAPFAAVILLAGFSLGGAPTSHWDRMLVGDEWLACLISIPVIAIVPFAVIILAVRMAAPTDLVRTGALAGLVAGGISALGYALHCTDDSLPFVALWYGGTIALCTLAGAVAGPKLLRW